MSEEQSGGPLIVAGRAPLLDDSAHELRLLRLSVIELVDCVLNGSIHLTLFDFDLRCAPHRKVRGVVDRARGLLLPVQIVRQRKKAGWRHRYGGK